MRTFTLLFFSLAALPTFAQVTFKTIYGTPFCDAPVAIDTTSQGGYIMAGNTTAHDHNMNAQLVSVNSNGDTLWTREYDTGGSERIYDMCSTTDGGFIMGGEVIQWSPWFASDALVIKTDASGNVLWSRTYTLDSADESICSIIQTSDGGYAIAGSTWYGSWIGEFDLILKLDANGNIVWMNEYRDSNWQSNIQSIAESPTGDLIAAGVLFFNTYPNHALQVMSVAPSGAVNWCHKYDSGGEVPSSTIVNSSGDIYVCGSNYISNKGVLMKLNASGVIQWSNAIAVGQFPVRMGKMIRMSNNELCVAGSLGSSQFWDGVIFRFDPFGNPVTVVQHIQIFSYEYDDLTWGLDGGVAILAAVDSAFGVNDSASYMLIKTTSSLSSQCGINVYSPSANPVFYTDSIRTIQINSGGTQSSTTCSYSEGLNIITACPLVGIEENSVVEAAIYPNPAHSSLTLTTDYTLIEQGAIFTIYNANGQIVFNKEIISERENIPCEDFAAGMYFYYIACGGEHVSCGRIIKE